jgi:hypothetical protein
MNNNPSTQELTFLGRPKNIHPLLSKKATAALSSIADENGAITMHAPRLHHLQDNLAQFERALEDIDQKNITPIPSEIAWPIWQRFTYTTDPVKSQAYLQLLATASSVETQHLAHPGFIHLIDQLTADEIQILLFINTHGLISEPLVVSGARISLKKILSLQYPQNLRTYLEHLATLGLIALEQEPFIEFERNPGHSDVTFLGKALTLDENFNEIKPPQISYNLTHFAQMFLVACFT